MPVVFGVGQSGYTAIKEDHYGRLLGWHIGVTQRAIQNDKQIGRWNWRPSYLLIDATSGSGTLEDGSAGSPLVALDKLSKMSIAWRAVFIEESLDVFASLDMALPNGQNIEKRCARYQDVFRQLERDDRQLGLLYIDPNGTPDFAAICELTRTLPRLEVLLSFTSTGIKRAGKTDVRVDEWIKRIGKRFWLVRKPYTSWRWSFLLGSDTVIFNKRYPRIEMEPATSEQGQHWLELLSYTDEERRGKDQPPLTGLMPIT